MKPKLKKNLATAIKIAISAVLIWLVFSKMDWKQIGELLWTVNLFYFFLAIVFFLLSQIISIIRFDVFIRKIGIRMSFGVNAQLYLLGMFYNFFLPGGVGGDAYKVYLLNKSHQKSLKKIGELIFIERFIGVLAIGFMACIILFLMSAPFGEIWNFSAGILGIILTLVAIKLLVRYLHSHKKRVHLVFGYSLMVQLAQLLSVFFILSAFHIKDSYLIYMFLFLVSSVLSVISFAGIGIREAVFFYGGQWFGFNPDVSAGIALTFSLFGAVVSFFGIIYLFKPIGLKNK